MENPNWLTRQNTSLCLMKEAAFQADTEKEIQKGNTDIFFSSLKRKIPREADKARDRPTNVGN